MTSSKFLYLYLQKTYFQIKSHSKVTKSHTRTSKYLFGEQNSTHARILTQECCWKHFLFLGILKSPPWHQDHLVDSLTERHWQRRGGRRRHKEGPITYPLHTARVPKPVMFMPVSVGSFLGPFLPIPYLVCVNINSFLLFLRSIASYLKTVKKKRTYYPSSTPYVSVLLLALATLNN